MIVGTTVHKLDGRPYYSPVIARGGGAARFPIDVTNIWSANVTFTVQHKNTEDTAWGNAGAFPVINAVNPHSLDVVGLKEEIRVELTFDQNDPPDAAVHFLIQAPSWRPY